MALLSWELCIIKTTVPAPRGFQSKRWSKGCARRSCGNPTCLDHMLKKCNFLNSELMCTPRRPRLLGAGRYWTEFCSWGCSRAGSSREPWRPHPDPQPWVGSGGCSNACSVCTAQQQRCISLHTEKGSRVWKLRCWFCVGCFVFCFVFFFPFPNCIICLNKNYCLPIQTLCLLNRLAHLQIEPESAS